MRLNACDDEVIQKEKMRQNLIDFETFSRFSVFLTIFSHAKRFKIIKFKDLTVYRKVKLKYFTHDKYVTYEFNPSPQKKYSPVKFSMER